MQLRKTVGTVGTLAQEAVSTAVSVARHPISTTAVAAGFVKGAAEAGIGLVRGGRGDQAPTTTTSAEEPDDSGPTLSSEPSPVASEAPEDPRDEIPGPDLAQFEPPRPEDLPEPVVIEADDQPANGESGEPFHNEPKAASRASEHGGPAGDREEIEGYVEEIPADLRGE